MLRTVTPKDSKSNVNYESSDRRLLRRGQSIGKKIAHTDTKSETSKVDNSELKFFVNVATNTIIFLLHNVSKRLLQ